MVFSKVKEDMLMHKLIQVALKYDPSNKIYDHLKLTHFMCFIMKILHFGQSLAMYLTSTP